MSNRIYGYITDSSRGDMPVGGLRVLVWDRDWLNGDDILGEANTDGNGHYEVRFQGRNWDKSLGIFTFGRPDIYISVDNKNSTGKWVRLAESEENRNHDLTQDLRIDLQVMMGSPVSKHTTFIPDVNGFHFINSFIVKPDILGVDLVEWQMGFCGGMCAGALNRFTAGLEIPQDEIPPGSDSPLHDELRVRQLKTMSIKMLPQMFEWQSAPEISTNKRKLGIGERTRDEWPKVKGALDDGKPTIIILIRASGYLGNPTLNHQVLAVGYDFDPATMDIKLFTYDPNIPGTTQTITCNIGLPEGRLDLTDSASPKTRGFFINPQGENAAV
jgi:hypothetical protein